MADVPYLTKTNSIKSFLKTIQDTGIPPKVNRAYLESTGFKSSNDRPLVPLFKFLGFLDSSEMPTELYRKYRDKKQAPKILGLAIMKAYSGLYATYPDAHKRDVEALANYFRSGTDLGDRAITAIVNTFKTLSESAEFEGFEEEAIEEEAQAATKKKARVTIPTSIGGASIVVNIQLTLPVTENESIYDKLFTSLRKNLLTPIDEEK